ncbi:Uncharacterised protein [Candidatus Azoamicus ciliaticola]|uniref:Uncharacterized protein n=1 Tax=Candidatus Azoamicus ciliaticola TaxID=2652803 RepID=A0A6J5JZ17_9GAMM|nr:Uncharacterised protein [Candidatus Azoamicus ciliaticola]
MFISIVLDGFLFFGKRPSISKIYFIKVYKKVVYFSVVRRFLRRKIKGFLKKNIWNDFFTLFIPYKFSLFLYFCIFIL